MVGHVLAEGETPTRCVIRCLTPVVWFRSWVIFTFGHKSVCHSCTASFLCSVNLGGFLHCTHPNASSYDAGDRHLRLGWKRGVALGSSSEMEVKTGTAQPTITFCQHGHQFVRVGLRIPVCSWRLCGDQVGQIERHDASIGNVASSTCARSCGSQLDLGCNGRGARKSWKALRPL